jgi:SAP domain
VLCADLNLKLKMVDKYGSWTVIELKNELKNRNAKCVGKNEALIER